MRIPIAILMSILVAPQPAAAAAAHRPQAPPRLAMASAGADLVAAVAARADAAVTYAGPPPGPTVPGDPAGPPPAAGSNAAGGPDAAGGPVSLLPARVSVGRRTAQWGFGSVVRPAPRTAGAYPQGWLYVARRDGAGGWQVALEGEPAFAALSRQAPILAAPERRLLGADPVSIDTGGTAGGAAGAVPGASGRPVAFSRTPPPAIDRRTGMRLPYTVGQRWRYTGGPHPMSGAARSSIDLAGGDGRVLAARGGLAYTMCPGGKGWIRVIHDRGFATDYYHLAGNIRASGKRVNDGTFLGMIGNDVSCGGASTGRHVHFSLLRNGGYVPISGYAFGKWVIMASAGQYDGTAMHGSYRAVIDTNLHNYGRLGFTQGVVDTDGARLLNRRAGPGSSHRLLGTVPDGATVTVACSRRGTTHTGRYGYTTNLWNRLTDRSWISDAYLSTGTPNPVNGYCR
ncbi:MAG TPA: peptidoglycan DD-metalloendopeptidase family protein [Catenuloplanes sp.]|jgi:LasA protease